MKKVLSLLIALTLIFGTVNFTSVDAASVKLNKSITFVRKGSPVKLKVKNTKKKVKWKSSNKKIATVSKKGVCTFKRDGECFAIAKVGGKTLKCHLVVTHKVAKKITKATMKKIAKKMKKKGTYNSSEKCYIYKKRFTSDGYVDLGVLKYYPKKNYIAVNYDDDRMDCSVEFHVGDKKYCKFSGNSFEYGIYAKGTVDKTRMSSEASAIKITDSNIAAEYMYTAQQYIYNYVNYEAYIVEQILEELKTDVYSEDLGFKWPISNYYDQ